MLHSTSSNKENQIKVSTAQKGPNVEKSGSSHKVPTASSAFESKIPKPSFVKKIEKQPEPAQLNKQDSTSVSSKTTSTKDAKSVVATKKEVPAKQSSNAPAVSTTKQTKDASSKSQTQITKTTKTTHSPLRKVSALDKHKTKPSSPRSPSTPSFRPFVVVVDKAHEAPEPFGSSPFKPFRQLDRTPPPADKVGSGSDAEINSPFETPTKPTLFSPEEIPIPLLNQANTLPKWSDFLKQLQEEEDEEKNRKTAPTKKELPKKVEKIEPVKEKKKEPEPVKIEVKLEEKLAPKEKLEEKATFHHVQVEENVEEEETSECDSTDAVFEQALKILIKDVERIRSEKESIIILDGTLRKGLSVESVMQSSKKKELLLAKQRSDFIVGVFERNNRFARINWDQFVELVENEEGFGKGSSLTLAKFKDVQKAYLIKARTGSF